MISNVSFAAKKDLYERPNLDAPQTYAKPQFAPQPEAPKKKGHRTLKVIAGIVAAAAAAIGAIALGSKYGVLKPETIKKFVPEKALNWEKLTKLKEPVKNVLASVEKFGNNVAEKALNGYTTVVNFVKNLIPKKSA